MGLKEKLKYETQFLLEDFPEIYQSNQKLTPDSHTQLMLENKTYKQTYDEFCNTILDGIENRNFVPVYRMADGEFMFINSRFANITYEKSLITSIFKKLKFLFSKHTMYGKKVEINKYEILLNLFDPNYKLVAHGEGYTKKESGRLEKNFLTYLKEIASHGKLALHFVKRGNKLVYEESIYKFLNWVDANKIDINEKNYLPFYHVYAILNGKFRVKLFNNRRILIVTSYDLKKKNLLKDYFNKERAKKVSFIKISSNKSMFDQIDVKQYIGKIDLVLVGAGIGSINILMQLKPLSVPCIDVGYALECMANDNLRRDRMFLELR